MNLIEIIVEKELTGGEEIPNGPSMHDTGTDKELLHNYVSTFYQPTFAPLQHKPISILEIGTCSGASLLLWKEFFTQGHVTGIDVVDRTLPKFRRDDITYHFYDAYTSTNVENLGMFDIIIDDGPHNIVAWKAFIDIYYSKLKQNGLMIIEDIQHEEDILPLSEYILEKCGKAPFIFDNRKETGIGNNILFCIQK